jgi:hypothetical protein
VAKKKEQKSRQDPAETLAQIERPAMNWKVVGQIGLGFAIVWLLSAMVEPWFGYWGYVVAGVLTLVGLGFGIYVFRLTRRSAAIVDILKTATDAEGRKAALEQLRAQGNGKDALNALAQAQLAAQDDPQEAVRILEAVNLEKAPGAVQDDVRANLALMYLVTGRGKDARKLVDEIHMDRQPQAKAKAMYAAVIAEARARTGDPDEGLKLLETYKADDPAYTEMRPLLLRAQVYTYVGAKKRGRAQTAMEQLFATDPNMVAVFLQKGAHPEVQKLARQVLGRSGMMPKPKMRLR